MPFEFSSSDDALERHRTNSQKRKVRSFRLQKVELSKIGEYLERVQFERVRERVRVSLAKIIRE
jgi:hypothetical protein